MLLNVELQIAKPQLIKANNKTLLKNELHCMRLHEFSDISENSNSLEHNCQARSTYSSHA